MTDQSDDEFDHDDWKYLLVKEKELLCWWEVSKFRRAALTVDKFSYVRGLVVSPWFQLNSINLSW